MPGPPDPPAGPLLLFDGECALCSRAVRFILRRDRRGRLRFAPLQSALGEAVLIGAGLDPAELSTMVLRTEDGRVLVRSDAVLAVAGDLTWPWSWTPVLRWVPRWLRDGAYRAVARYRVRLFGGPERCLLPEPEHADRMLG